MITNINPSWLIKWFPLKLYLKQRDSVIPEMPLKIATYRSQSLFFYQESSYSQNKIFSLSLGNVSIFGYFRECLRFSAVYGVLSMLMQCFTLTYHKGGLCLKRSINVVWLTCWELPKFLRISRKKAATLQLLSKNKYILGVCFKTYG